MPNTNPCGSQFEVHACPCEMCRDRARNHPRGCCEIGDASLDVGVLIRLCKETINSIFRSSTTARPWTAKERADSHYADPPGRRRGGAIGHCADFAGSGEGARSRPG